jgi:hypothetical protein
VTRPGPQEWGGGFEDVREIEQRVRRKHAEEVANLKQTIALVDGILQLETSSGFKQFTQTLRDMLDARTTDLLSAREDREAAVLQGRCQELRVILFLMVNAHSRRQALANQVAGLEDAFRELERSFKPIPQGQPS